MRLDFSALTFDGFFFGGVRDDDAAFSDLDLFGTFDQDTIIQGFNLHVKPPQGKLWAGCC